ncbi:MAG: pantoate--beta-alanine ligase [Magnetospirillum sp.]
MSESIDIVRTKADLRARVQYWRDQGLSVAFAPTMGALHDGHLTLVRTALELADRVVVSVFVNPTQFGPNEDFSRYPRQEEQDAAALAGAGCHLLYAPSVDEMYPEGFATNIHVSGVSEGLCGDIRPGHFDGVATVVGKLLLQVGPHMALFGEKDWQQLTVIRRLVRDLDIPVEVVGVPTVREFDGLARSSRNAYLSQEERRIAPILHQVLSDMAEALRQGGEAATLCADGIRRITEAGFLSVDYLEVRAADSLVPLARLDGPARILVAARLSGARLIDNLGVEPLHA